MITTTWNDILLGKTKFDGYAIYAIADNESRVAYVGMTKNVRSRLISHLNEGGQVGSLLPEGRNLAVTIYSLNDVNNLYRTRTNETLAAGSDNNQAIDDSEVDLYARAETERKKANVAEWYMIRELKPYLNDRKAWHIHPDRAAPHTAKYLEALRKGAEEYELTLARELEALRKNAQHSDAPENSD